MNKYFSFGIFALILVIIASFFLFWQNGSQEEIVGDNDQQEIINDNESEMEKVSSNFSLDFELIADGFVSPVDIVEAPDNSGRLFVVDRIGQVRIIDSNGILLENPFIDISHQIVDLNQNYDERGLLGLAFHPNFSENGRFFLHYSAPSDSSASGNWDHTGIISEFKASSNENVAEKDFEKEILSINQPQKNHNGGQIAFGNDGYLYIGLGDGGGRNDVGAGHSEIGNGQDKNTLLGSILRIDVDSEDEYSIPSSNPFSDSQEKSEIYAYGFRNPFKFSFDDDDLYVADVGQNLWEEINLVENGKNYGWNIMEGSYCFDPESPDVSHDNCEKEGLELPIIEYSHEGDVNGLAVIGGYVYRGNSIPELVGKYVFADWSSSFALGRGKILIASKENGIWNITDSVSMGEFILSLGKDSNGEIYVLTTEASGPIGTGGKVYKIIEK